MVHEIIKAEDEIMINLIHSSANKPSIVRENIITRKNYTPYCGNFNSCKLPRTLFVKARGQFICPECSWESSFESETIEKYKVYNEIR